MSFLRPEATAQLLRWREALIGLVFLLAGARWLLTGTGLMPYIGAVLAAIGIVLLMIGWQRARFRLPGRGPGVVRITEDQIAYFGPLTGGAVALADMTQLSLDRTGTPAHWVLRQPGEADLFIPLTADGGEALFDAFARLPGLQTERMLAQMRGSATGQVVIWQAENDRPRLH